HALLLLTLAASLFPEIRTLHSLPALCSTTKQPPTFKEAQTSCISPSIRPPNPPFSPISLCVYEFKLLYGKLARSKSSVFFQKANLIQNMRFQVYRSFSARGVGFLEFSILVKSAPSPPAILKPRSRCSERLPIPSYETYTCLDHTKDTPKCTRTP